MNPRWGVRPKPILRLRTATPTNSLRSLLRLRWTSTRRLQMDSLVRSNLLGELKTKTKINSISSKVVLKKQLFSIRQSKICYCTEFHFGIWKSPSFYFRKITLAFKIRHWLVWRCMAKILKNVNTTESMYFMWGKKKKSKFLKLLWFSSFYVTFRMEGN